MTGVEYLHNNKIAHRDIKAENIALGSKGIPKLIDFSLSNFQKNGIELLRTPCGSPEYAAPEVKIYINYRWYKAKSIMGFSVIYGAVVYYYLLWWADICPSR